MAFWVCRKAIISASKKRLFAIQRSRQFAKLELPYCSLKPHTPIRHHHSMHVINNFELHGMLDIFLSLLFAFIFGTMIGLERQIRQRTAGLRTNTLVAIAAAAFVDLGLRLNGVVGGTTLAAYIVSGVGFLGAGAIMKEGANITGLNTAATLWGSAAVGAMCGAGYVGDAGVVTIFVLAANTLLRHVVNYLHRHPPSSDASESNYHMYVICERMTQAETLSRLQQLLESSGYPARSIEKHSLGASDTEIEVLLLATIAKSDELNAITTQMEQSAGVKGAFWHTSPLNG